MSDRLRRLPWCRNRVPIGGWLLILEERGLDGRSFGYDDRGALNRIAAPRDLVEQVIDEGWAFMTNGCPSSGGEPGCTRPMGSWQPSERPRDYPWRPDVFDRGEIRAQLALDEILRPGPGPARPPEGWAPPAAGRLRSVADR